MKDEEQIRVEGEHPATASWLVPLIETALGEREDRWTYDLLDLGGSERTDLRLELRSPTRDAALTVSATASQPSGRFTRDQALTVSVRRTLVPAHRPGRRTPGQIDELQRRIVRLVEEVSDPESVLTPEEAAALAARRRRRRRRLSRLIIVVAVLTVVVNGLSLYGLKLAYDDVSTAAVAAYRESIVIKGSKPKKATACRATVPSTLTPTRSATGNRRTTCPLAEAVRQAYLDSPDRGRTALLPAIPGIARPVTCRGATRVRCTNADKLLVYLY